MKDAGKSMEKEEKSIISLLRTRIAAGKISLLSGHLGRRGDAECGLVLGLGLNQASHTYFFIMICFFDC